MDIKDIIYPVQDPENNLDMTDEIPNDPFGGNPNAEDRSNWSEQTIIEENPFLNKIIEELNQLKETADSFDGIIKINNRISQILKDAQGETSISVPFMCLENHMAKIEDDTFDWLFEHANLPVVAKVFEIFDVFDKDQHFKYVNFDQIREQLPIRLFMLYLSKPFSANEEDVVTYGEIIGFHSLILGVFTKIYIRSFMSLQPFIDATEIYTIDPFMRNEYRKRNIDFFIQNFWSDDNFELYGFLEKLIDSYVLAGLPKWVLARGKPILVPILELIDYLFGYGLISYEFCKPLLRFLYLTSETLKSLEMNVENMDTESVNFEKCKQEFIFCREKMSSILIQILTLFCDAALEESLVELLSGKSKVDYFKSFLYADKGSYNYFSSIVIKYLCNYVCIKGGAIESEVINSNLVIIFNFIGDVQKDSFILSMELVNVEYYNYYSSFYENNFRTSEHYPNATEINKATATFAEKVRYTTTEYLSYEFEQLTNQIATLIEPHLEQQDFKLELAVNNFAALWLSIIDLQGDKCSSAMIDKALTILMHICKNNYPSQNVLFRGAGYENFFNIMSKHTFSALILLRRVFEPDAFLLYLSHDMFLINLNEYIKRVKDLASVLETLPDNLNGVENIPDISHKIGILFYFNLYFDCLLEDHLIKISRRKRYDTLLSSELTSIVTSFVIPKLKYITAQPNADLVIMNEIMSYSIEQRPEIIKRLSETDPKVLITQLCYYTLKIFNKSTFKLYGGGIYDKITALNIYSYAPDTVFTFPQSILIRLEFVKLFDRFYVFFPNHLITKRTIINPHEILFVGENYIPSNYWSIRQFINNEFKWFDKYMNHFSTKDETMMRYIRKYLFKGLLPLIYKFLKGVNVHITKLQEPSLITDLKKTTDEIIDELEPRLPQIYKILEINVNQSTAGSKIRGLFGLFNSKLAEPKEETGAIAVNKVAALTECEVDENDNIEERINPDIKILRTNLTTAIKKLHAIFENTKYEYNIIRFARDLLEDENTDYMNRVFKNSETFRKDFGIVVSNMYKRTIVSPFNDEFKKLKREYKLIKFRYQDDKHMKMNNQFLAVLSSIKDAKQNLGNIIKYFINHIEKLHFVHLNRNPKMFYLNNEFFFSSLVILDNLNVWNSAVKIEFLKILKEMPTERRTKILENLWGTFISLYLLVIFKTFMDKEWESFWAMYYVISTFLQNLCEENNIEFKEFFNNNAYAVGAISNFTNKKYAQGSYSIFFECYILLENAINFTEFWITDSPKIVPSDRAELFPIFKRLFSQVTEFLTGPCLTNQLHIYRYRIDLWNGIINRMVDDLDSRFYEVKLACLYFISGLLEGLNNDIVTFMGSNLQINKLFSMITRLTKKLYVRQILLEKKTNGQLIVTKNLTNMLIDVMKTGQNKNNNLLIFPEEPMNSEITIEQENMLAIKSHEELIDMYKRFRSTFSEHIILDVILTTYVMLINMSFKLKFYEFFLKDKDNDAKLFLKEPLFVEPEKLEDVHIYLFLKNITANIEVVYDSDSKRRLIRTFFRIPAECFFLTDDMRSDFIKYADFSSTQSKHISLFDAVEPLRIEMQTNKRYFEKFGIFYLVTTTDFFKSNQVLLYLLSLALNILMLIFLTSEGIAEDSEDLISQYNGGKDAIKIVAIVITVYSGLLTVLWLMFKYKIEILCAEAEYKVYHNEISKNARINIRLFKALLFQPRFLSFYNHFIFTVLGLALDNPFFFTLNLFLLTNLIKPVNYVLQSIIKHYGKLLITITLTILVIFCYSFILLTFYSDSIKTDDFTENVCKDFLRCFFNSVNLGLRLGGGVSDAFNLAANISSGGVFYGRFFYDLTFFILIKLIFLNLIAGIIIDTFSDMRDELTERTKVICNVCFICGKSRWQIEKDGLSFKKHIGKDHTLWKYLFYVMRLKSVNSSSFDGIEQNIYEKVNRDDSSWIPQNVYLQRNANYKILDDEDADEGKEMQEDD